MSNKSLEKIERVQYIESPEITNGELGFAILRWTIFTGLTVWTTVYAFSRLKEIFNHELSTESTGALRKEIAKRLRRPELANIDYTAHEAKIARDSVASIDELTTTFENIGGLESVVGDIQDNIVLPMKMWRLYKGQSQIVPCPTGVLLYGRPGTGKTLMAKALAKEAEATFINIKAGSIMEKWLGETDKLVTAIFSLAKKLAPSIVFIDEIDTLLKKRDGNQDCAAQHSMQGVFLSEWDGLQSTSTLNGPVIVLGATNRPMDLDKAFLRRMPLTIKTPAPDCAGREDILVKMLQKESVGACVNYKDIAVRTEDFTGSDLRELIRVASLQRMKALFKSRSQDSQINKSSSTGANGNASVVPPPPPPTVSPAFSVSDRPLLAQDFEHALKQSKRPGTVQLFLTCVLSQDESIFDFAVPHSDDAVHSYSSELKVEEYVQKINVDMDVLKTIQHLQSSDN